MKYEVHIYFLLGHDCRIPNRKRPFHWISKKSRLVSAAIETSKFQN